MPPPADTATGPEPSVPAIKRFASAPWREKWLSALAFGLMLLAAAALRLVHFRRIAPLLGTTLQGTAYAPLANPQQLSNARIVRRAILRAARLSPFRSDCLPQAMVAAMLCRMLGVPAAVHLGVKLDDGPRKIDAHAWVCSGPEAICGGRGFGSYTPVSCFVTVPVE